MRAWKRPALGLVGLALVAGSGCAGVGTGAAFDGMHAYLWPASGRLAFFTCRWLLDEPLRVSLQGQPSDEEQGVVAAALEAWQEADLGIRFEVTTPQEAQLRIALVDEPLERSGDRPAAGRTAVDCHLPAGRVADARLAQATLWLSRAVGPDWRGHSRPASPAELMGTLLHELGHALGFQGHPRFGGLMAREVEATRRRGEAVLAGAPLDPGPLGELYRKPSGHLLRELAVDPWRTAPVDGLLAEPPGPGPFVRVGDRSAVIFWRDEAGEPVSVVVHELRGVYRRPESVLPIGP